MRAAAMTEADTVFVIGRKLDYQLGYGSPAVFPNAKFIRLADTPGELIDNRRGEPEILATPALALDAIVAAAGNRKSAVDRAWTEGLQKRHRDRSAKAGPRYTTGSDGRVDPRVIFQALREKTKTDYIAIADGGDLLSFARVGLEARTYMDAGAFGCLGIGTPYAIAASLAYPGRQVVCVTGDGAFGINAMEIDTAVRHGAKIVVIVSNNGAWNIERLDQETNYGGRVVGTLLGSFRLCGYGPGFRSSWRARGEAGGSSRRYRAGARKRPRSGRRGDLSDGRVLGRDEGAGLRPGVPAADRLGRSRAQAPRSGVRLVPGRGEHLFAPLRRQSGRRSFRAAGVPTWTSVVATRNGGLTSAAAVGCAQIAVGAGWFGERVKSTLCRLSSAEGSKVRNGAKADEDRLFS